MNLKAQSLSRVWLFFFFFGFLYQIATTSPVERNLFGRQLLKIKLIIPSLFTYECKRLNVIPSSLDFTGGGEPLESEDSFLVYCYIENVTDSFAIISYFNVIVFFLGRHLFLFINR